MKIKHEFRIEKWCYAACFLLHMVTPNTQSAEQPFKAITIRSLNCDAQATNTKDGRIIYHRSSDNVRRTFYFCAPDTLAFSPDAKYLVAAGKSSCAARTLIKVWPLNGKRWAVKMKLPAHDTEALAISNQRLVVATKTAFHSFLLSNGKQEWTMAKDAVVTGIEFTHDGDWIKAEFKDQTTRTYPAEGPIKTVEQCVDVENPPAIGVSQSSSFGSIEQ